MITRIKRIKNCCCGQGLLEYIILSSLVGIFCLVAVKELGSVVKKRIEFLQAEIVEHVKLN